MSGQQTKNSSDKYTESLMARVLEFSEGIGSVNERWGDAGYTTGYCN